MPDGTYKKIVKRKSPGTFGICAAIKYKYNVDPVPHLLCNGFTREETEDALIELNYIGIENVLVVRGDAKYTKPIPDGRTINKYAIDLVKQVVNMNNGIYLDPIINAVKTKFCIGVAAYPEKHFEAPNMKFDLQNLLNKQKAGAHYAVTQMFFDNKHYYRFLEQARAMGITMPIIPGLKILTSKRHITSLPATFHISLPEELVDRVLAAKDKEEVLKVGVEWAYRQALDLLQHGAPCIHFYIMQNTRPFLMLMEKLKKHL